MLQLERYNLRAPGFTVRVYTDATNYYHLPLPEVSTYRGRVQGDPRAVVSAIIKPDGKLRAQVVYGNWYQPVDPVMGTTPWSVDGIQTAYFPSNNYTYLLATNMPVTVAAGNYPAFTNGFGGPRYVNNMQKFTARRCNMVVDIMNDFFVNKCGSSLLTALAKAESQMNDADLVTARDNKIAYQMTCVSIRAATQDPFSGLTSGGGLLSKLSSVWSPERSTVPYDKVHCFTSDGYGAGGMAYAPGDYSYTMDSGYYGGVICHEVGHNWWAKDYEATKDYTGTNGYQHAMNGSGLTYCPETVNRAIANARGKSLEWVKYNYPLPPYAAPDYATTTKNTARTIDVLLNDYDINSNTLSVVWFSTNTARGGTVALASGQLRYTPAANFVGTDTFFYRLSDGTGFESGSQVMALVVDPVTPLLAQWNFDETNGVTVAEASGRGVAARLSGGLDFAQDGAAGIIGRALHLDGVGYVECLNHCDPLDANVSFAVWVRPSVTPTAKQYLLKKGYGGDDWGGCNLVAEPTRFRFYGNMFGNYSSSAFSAVANLTPQPDTWYFVVAQLDRVSNLARIWVNGVEFTATANSRSLANGASGEYVVGNGTLTLGSGFQGVMDDFRIYGKALTQAEITALYTSAGHIPAGGPAPADGERDVPLQPVFTWLAGRTNYQHDFFLGTNLAAVQAATTLSPEYQGRLSTNRFTPIAALLPATPYFWRVDEILSGTNVAPGSGWTFRTAVDALHGGLRLQCSLDSRDTIGAKTYDRAGPPFEDGTLSNGPLPAAGQVREALDFNGTSQYVDIPALNLGVNTLTITAWVKRNGTQNSNAGLVFMRGSTASGLGLGTNNRLGYHWNDTAASYSYNSGLTLPDGEWALAALVIEPTRAVFYLGRTNGVLTSATNTTTHAISPLTSNFRLASDSTSSSRYFKGSLDEVGLWIRALNRAEIGQLLTNGIAGGGIDGPVPPPDPNTFTWVGATDNLWTTPANWATNATPGSGDTILFNDASQQNLDTQLGQPFSITGAQVTGGLRALGIASAGPALTIGAGGLNLSHSIADATLAAPITLAANQAWSLGPFASLTVRSNVSSGGRTLTVNADGNATFGGVFSGSGALVKNGVGTATITGAGQTLTGGITVNYGTLKALGGGWSSSFFANVSPRTITLNSNATLETTTHSLGGLGGSFYQPTITLNEGATWQLDAEQYLSAGNLVLKGATVDIRANDLRIQSGTVNVNSSALPSAVTGAGSITLHGDTTLNVANGAQATDFSVELPINSSGTRALTKTGAGTLALARACGFTGTTTVSAGVLELSGGDDTLPPANALNLSSGATLRLVAGNQAFRSLSGSGNIELGANALTLDNTNTLALSSLISGTAPGTPPAGEGDTLPPSLGGLTKTGAGALVLTANNTYTGPTYILEGSLQIGNDGNSGTAGTGEILNETQLIFRRGTTTASYGNPIHGSGTTVKRNAGQIILTGSFTNNVRVENGKLNFNGPAFAPQLTLEARTSLGAPGGVTIGDYLSLEGHRFIISSGQTFAVLGNTIPVGGLLRLSMGTLTLLPPGGVGTFFTNTGIGLSVVSNSTVDVSACSTVTLAASTIADGAALELTAQTNATVASVFTGPGRLLKTGNARLTLSTASSFKGDTVITQGTLALSGSGNLASSNVVVATGATLDVTGRSGGVWPLAEGQTLRGTGTVLGTVNVASGSTIAPGLSAGTLATGNQIWSSGGSYVWEVTDTNADLLAITGTLDVAATAASKFTLKLVTPDGPLAGFSSTSNRTWTIATTTGGVLNFTTEDLAVDVTSFANDLAGGTFSVAVEGNNLVLKFAPYIPPPPPGFTGLVPQSDGSMQLSVTGAVGQTVILLGTTNLGTPVWMPVLTNLIGPGGSVIFTDTQATNLPLRFYRASSP